MKLWQLTFLEKRTETTYDAESRNKFSDELNKELTDETGFNFLTYEQKFDELQSDSADFVTTARGKAIAPTSGATKELRTSSTEKSEARRVTVSILTMFLNDLHIPSRLMVQPRMETRARRASRIAL